MTTKIRSFGGATCQDLDEPNLMRDIFPYDEAPRIDFDHKLLPIDPAEDIFITDTTFRDGQQARPPYTVRQIETIFEMLHRLSGPNGVIRQSEFFLYTDKDRQALDACLAKGYEYPQITGWIRAVEEDLDLVVQTGFERDGNSDLGLRLSYLSEAQNGPQGGP